MLSAPKLCPRLPSLRVSLAALGLAWFAAACGGSESADGPSPASTIGGARASGTVSSGPDVPDAVVAGALAQEPGTLPGERAVLDPLFVAKYAKAAPDGDDWDTEQVAERLGTALLPVKAWLHAPPAERPDLGPVVADGFACTPLRPACDEVFADGVHTIARAVQLPTEVRPAALADELGDLLGAFHGAPLERVKFKVTEVVLEDGAGGARLLVQAHGPGGDGAVQVNAEWWAEFTVGDSVRLTALRVEAHEEARAAARTFEDVTEAVLARNASYTEQLAVGLDAWAGRVDAALGMSLIGHEGLAVGDANGDGLDDLYLCQPGGLPNLLYVRRPDGTAVDRSSAAGVDFLDASRSALFLDLDGDGDQDLVVEADPVLLLLANDGTGRFTLRAEVPAPATTSLAAADYDGDGDLDLFACGYMLPDEEQRTPIPYHDANNGRPNTLLRNDLEGETWTFTDVTRSVGLDRNNRRYSFAAAWEDYDDDGDPDLYVANDFGRNNLYRNDGSRFVDVAAEAGVEDISAGMGVTWSDLDRDGRMDLYVSNMFSSAGGRIAYQRRFQAGASEDARSNYRRHARGNTLFRNLGGGRFADVSEQAGVTMGRWAWGSVATDLQNDGWPDLVVPNGFVTGEDPDDL